MCNEDHHYMSAQGTLLVLKIEGQDQNITAVTTRNIREKEQSNIVGGVFEEQQGNKFSQMKMSSFCTFYLGKVEFSPPRFL